MAPPKAVPYLTVGFGTRPQRLKQEPGAPPYKPPKPKPHPLSLATAAMAAPTKTKQLPMGNSVQAGRPVSNLGKYLIRPTSEGDTGFEMLNDEPDLIDKVNKQFLKKGQLPTALQPKYLRKPEVLEKNRSNQISKGWRAPRSQRA